MFSKDFEYIIGQCYKCVCEVWYEFMMVEYLFLVLFDNFFVQVVFKVCGVDVECLCQEFEQVIEVFVLCLVEDDGCDIQFIFGFQCVL